MILTHQQIAMNVAQLASSYDLKRVSYFGSYARGNANSNSDLDLLVEFRTD